MNFILFENKKGAGNVSLIIKAFGVLQKKQNQNRPEASR